MKNEELILTIESLSQEERDFLINFGDESVLRKLMTSDEIKISNKLVKRIKNKTRKMVKIFTKEDIEVLKSLTVSNPNDQSLGQSVRSLYRGNEFVSDYPNDYDLGSEIRKLTKNK